MVAQNLKRQKQNVYNYILCNCVENVCIHLMIGHIPLELAQTNTNLTVLH